MKNRKSSEFQKFCSAQCVFANLFVVVLPQLILFSLPNFLDLDPYLARSGVDTLTPLLFDFKKAKKQKTSRLPVTNAIVNGLANCL